MAVAVAVPVIRRRRRSGLVCGLHDSGVVGVCGLLRDHCSGVAGMLVSFRE